MVVEQIKLLFLDQFMDLLLSICSGSSTELRCIFYHPGLLGCILSGVFFFDFWFINVVQKLLPCPAVFERSKTKKFVAWLRNFFSTAHTS
jgi:hypothetical protein